MSGIADFLLARIAEDEAAVREHPEDSWDTWYYVPTYDPARVLAECDAKRQIVELHATVTVDCAGEWWTSPGPPGTYVRTGCAHCTGCGVDGEEYVTDGPCDTLKLLALPYADHPDYDETWRP